MLSVGRNDPCPCGSGQKYKKCCADKPLNSPVLHARKPQSLPAELVNMLQQAGGAMDQGDNLTAITLAQKVRMHVPDNEDALFIAGTALARTGQLEEGARLLARAAELHPHMTRNHVVLAGVRYMQHDAKLMLEIMRTALANDPGSALVQQWFGLASLINGRLDDAVDHVRKAVRLSDGPNLEAMELLYAALKRAGRLEEAEEEYRKLHAVHPQTLAKLTALFMFPEIPSSSAHIDAIRSGVQKDIVELKQAGLTLTYPDSKLRVPAFFLAFHGRDDKPILEEACALFRECCPELNDAAPHCRNWQGIAPGKPIVVGVVSEYFYNHSVGTYMNQLFSSLQAMGGFEVHAFSLGGRADAKRQEFASLCAGFHELPLITSLARDMIAPRKLDILLYPDVGMNAFSYFLAFYRLAPIQCVLPGHPVTTGIDTMDYFISSDLLEPEGAQAHYSETLLTIPEFVGWSPAPTLPETWLSRSELGLPEDARLYAVPMMLQKMHPDFDEALRRILEKDPQGRIVLVRDAANPQWERMLKARLAASLGPLAGRVQFLDWMAPPAFMSLLREAEVILDPFHLGGGTTFFLMAATGSPFVTLPGAFMRGRIGDAFARKLGIEEVIAASVEEYAEKAVRIAQDSAYRQGLKERILARAPALYGDSGSARMLAELLRTLPERHGKRARAA